MDQAVTRASVLVPGKVLVLLPWGNAIEDFLDTISCRWTRLRRHDRDWLFSHAEELRGAGWRTMIYCISRDALQVERRPHVPSGATVRILPQPAFYRRATRGMADRYAAAPQDAYGRPGGRPSLTGRIAWEIALYLAIPPLPALVSEVRRDGSTALLAQEYECARFDICELAGRLLGLPVFAILQGRDRHHCRVEQLLRPRALSTCTGLVVASAGEAERLAHCYGVALGRIAHIPNPLNLQLWFPEERAAARTALGWAQIETISICHDRIEMHNKGLDVLLEAWAQVRCTRPGAPLRPLLVGDGTDAPVPRRAVVAPDGEGVTWLDHYILDRALMRRHLGACNVAVLPARYEGFPVASLEAIACGLPLVGADAPGVPEILEGGENAGGLLVPRGDASALAAALGRLIDDLQLRQQLGVAARAWVTALRFRRRRPGAQRSARRRGTDTGRTLPPCARRTTSTVVSRAPRPVPAAMKVVVGTAMAAGARTRRSPAA